MTHRPSFVQALCSPYSYDWNWINAVDQEVDQVEVTVDYLNTQLARARQQIADLSQVVAALVAALDQAGVVKGADLQARIEREAARAASQHAAADEVACARCGASVPRARTNITAHGTVCDACFERTGGM